MARILTTFAAVAGYLFSAGVFYLILVYLGQFSVRQGIVLAFVVAWLQRGLHYAAPKSARRFSPYFTIVHQSEDFERTLIYFNHCHTFASEVDCLYQMETIKMKQGSHCSRRTFDTPELFMKYGADGYDLGIELPNSWWEEMKAHCPPPAHEKREYATGSVRLTLATIPNREFDIYWEPVEYDRRWVDRVHAVRNQHREHLGWKKIEEPDIPELAIRWPERIEHKYFNVQHRDV